MKIKTLTTMAIAAALVFFIAPSQADTILMDFGYTSTTGQPQTWNNINSTMPGWIQGTGNITNSGASLSLLNSAGASSGITVTVNRSFSQSNVAGPSSTTTGYPGTATSDSLYGNVEPFNSGGITTANVYPELNFSGLNPSLTYNFTFYASRGTTSDNRDSRYTLTGASSSFTDLNAANNVNNVATISNFSPNAGGNILFDLSPGPANTSANHFSYIGVIEIDYTLNSKKSSSVLVGSSENPSTNNDNVIFTAAVQTNAVTAGDATGNVVFEANGVAFGTNAFSGGTAIITNNTLPGGTNIITAEYTGDNQYLGSTNILAGGQVVTLNGIMPTIATLPVAGAISYGQILANSILSGGAATNAVGVPVAGSFAFTTPGIAPNAGTTNVGVTFTPTDPSYVPVSTNVTVSVDMTTPGLSLTASAIAFGQPLASSSLGGSAATNPFNTAPVSGSFTFITPSIVPNLGLTNVSVTFTPTDTADYNSTTGTVSVVVVTPGRDILIDFGPNDGVNGNIVTNPDYLGQYWNNMVGPGGGSTPVTSGTGLANLITTNNVVTSIGLIINSGFSANGIQNGGLLTPSYALLGNFAVTNATEDYFFTTTSASLALTNLNADTLYRLRLFGSRDTDAGTTRTTQYVLTCGNGSFTNTLQTSGNNGWTNNGAIYYGNDNTIVSVNGIIPDSNNQIQLGLTSPTGGFAYLGIMEITEMGPVITTTSIIVNRASGLPVRILKSSLATDALGSPLTFTTGSTTNGATLTQDSNYIYVPANTVADQFTFTVNDSFGATNTGMVTIPIGAVTPTITILPTASAISYGQTLASSTLSGGAATNADSGVTVAGSFAFTTPGTAPNAGTTNVSVTFTPVDTADYNSVTTTVPVTVNGIVPTITILPTASAISYGQTLASSTLSGGAATNADSGVPVAGSFAFTTPGIAPNAGLANVGVTFMPTDPAYNTSTATVAVTVSQTTPYLTAPTASAITLGQSLASSTLSGGAAVNPFNTTPVAGSFAFSTPSTVPSSSTNVGVTFTPTDTTDYTTATTAATVNVSKSIVVFGSSVALGVGSSGYLANTFTNGSYVNGYAAFLTYFLTPQGWSVTNISIAGQKTSDGLARFNSDLVPLSPNYVWLGYALWNEGLGGATDPLGIVTTFTSNLTNLIALCHSHGFYPVSGLNYPNNNYTASEYAYLKSANLTINTWNVPSVNFLGALDNGNGQWISGYWYDALHPNDAGHREMFYSFVPSLFAAISAGKTNSPQLAAATNFARLTQDPSVTSPITFTPSNIMHSFTMSFRVRSINSGTVAAICTGTNYATIQIQGNNLVYVSTNGQQISILVNATNGNWHDVALAYRYALTNTALFVDGNLAGNLTEQYVPSQFILGGPAGASGQPNSPLVADYQNWCVYRAAWNLNEAQAQQQGNRQQASMEICATLDDASFASGNPATNRAQSLSVALVNTANLAATADVSSPSNLTAQRSGSSSVALTWTRNSTSETGFVIERRLAGTVVWNDLSILPPGSIVFTNTGLAMGTTYEYRVAALEGGLRSGYSNSAKYAAGVHQDILVNFGPNDDADGDFVSNPDYMGQYWNNMYGPGGGSTFVNSGTGLANLITTNNITTPIGLAIGSGFQANGIASGGLLTPSYALLGNFAVTNATEDYFFTTTSASISITNLDPTAVYSVRFFGTRNTSAGSSRITAYTVSGGNGSFTTNLQTSGLTWTNNGVIYYGNNITIVNMTGITPDGNNHIQVGITSAAGGFAYLGIMELTADHPPVAANMTCYRQNGLPLQISIINLLTNVTDADGDTITLTGVGAGAIGATIATNNSFISYTPATGANSNANDSFTYTVSDGYGGSATATINVNVFNATGPAQIGIPSGGMVNIRFFGTPTYNYEVQTATNLSGPWWPLGTNTPGIDGSWLFIDPNATNAQQYYRIIQP